MQLENPQAFVASSCCHEMLTCIQRGSLMKKESFIVLPSCYKFPCLTLVGMVTVRANFVT